jgi:DNA polymerase-1
MSKRKRLVLVDANAIIHRAFHALPHLTTKSGELVNAVYGFTMILLNMLKELKPRYIDVCFDSAAPTFRHKEFVGYKAKRVKAPDELYNQIPRVKDVIAAFNMPIFAKDGFEADDLIGALNFQAGKDPSVETIIVTGDLDMLQLIDQNTKVYTMRRGLTETVIYDIKTVKERFGFGPEHITDYKGLRGDASDNIPGVPGIGEKTAAKLISQFGSIDEIFKNKNKLPDRIKKILDNAEEEALFSKKLATIATNVPIKLDLAKSEVVDYDRAKVVRLFQMLEFKSLLNKLPTAPRPKQAGLFDIVRKKVRKIGGRYQIIKSKTQFTQLIKTLKKFPGFAFDTETDYLDGDLIGMSFSVRPKEAYYLPVDHPEVKELSKKYVLAKIKPLLENQRIAKFGHNIKYDYRIIMREGIKIQPLSFDTMVASYLVNPHTRTHNLDQVAFIELGYEKIPLDQLIDVKKFEDLSRAPLNKVAEYACEDADITLRLKKHFEKLIKKNGLGDLFYNLEMPLVPVLAEMEEAGIKLDVVYLKKINTKFTVRIFKIIDEIYRQAGKKFNISSTQQLREVLFTDLKLLTSEIKKTKTGLSTAASELAKLRGQHKIIDLLFEYRELTKLKNTYIDALPRLVSKKDGRLHTSFNQTVTATGRLSSSEPNLQNIPIRTEIGKEIRRAFLSEPGMKLVCADYSQIELRVAAHISKDQNMLKAFLAGEDIHSATAANIYGVPLEKVTKVMRRSAKTVNFGVLYGMNAYGMSQRLGVDVHLAKEFIDKYFRIYQDLYRYTKEIVEAAKATGYVETLLGRRRYLPELNASLPAIRRSAERMAVNMPIQGTAADIMKLAMIEVAKKLPKISPKSKMLLQVHDELVFEVPDSEIKKVAQVIKKTMDEVYKLSVPLEVDISAGNNWRDLKKLKV